MKSVLGKSRVKKTMRVATVFTGVFAGAAAYAPAAKADTAVPWPYVLWVYTGFSIHYVQACGYKDVGTGEWYCTAKEANPHGFSAHSQYFGGNWKDGKVNIWEWGKISPNDNSIEVGHTCNTNGSYTGHLKMGAAGDGVSLSTGYIYLPWLGVSSSNAC
jgi:hypothetical protein